MPFKTVCQSRKQSLATFSKVKKTSFQYTCLQIDGYKCLRNDIIIFGLCLSISGEITIGHIQTKLVGELQST